MLALSVLSLPAPLFGATTHPDWARVKRAQEHLARRNFSGALGELDKVDQSGEAAEVALQVRSQVDEAMAGRMEVEATGFADTQPLRWSRLRAKGSGWATPVLEMGLEGASHLVEAPLPTTPRGQVEATASMGLWLFDANLWLPGEVTLSRWTDSVFILSGQARAEARWLNPVRFSLSLGRDQVTVTEDSIREHIVSDYAQASARLNDFHGWYAEVGYRYQDYSDSNTDHAAHSWLLIPFIRGKFQLSGGYGGTYSNSQETRWDFIAQRYTPYFSPLDQWRHGPITSVRLAIRPATFELKGTLSWVDELDPNAEAWSIRARRTWLAMTSEAALEVELSSFSTKATYQYEHQIYYQYHQASLSFGVPLR